MHIMDCFVSWKKGWEDRLIAVLANWGAGLPEPQNPQVVEGSG
jgi:hypothetical protein